MPYKLKSFGKGKYKVCKKNSNKCFSKKPLPKARAQAQMAAMHINTNENIELPSEENVFKGRVFTDDNLDEEELKNYFANNGINLSLEEINMAWDYYMNNEDIQVGEEIDGTPLTYAGTEHNDEVQYQEHVKFNIDGSNLTLEIVNVNGEFKELFLSDESKEPAEENEESYEESLSFERLFETIMGK